MLDIEISVSEKGRKDLAWSLESDINGEITMREFLQFMKNSLIAISFDVLKEEQGRGFDKKPIVVTDNRINKSPLLVSPFGQIEYVSTDISSLKIIVDIYQKIEERSKVVTGTYIEGNFVFLNGSVIATDSIELGNWAAKNPKVNKGDIFRFVNVVPYARKLERYGVTAQRSRARTVKSKNKKNPLPILAPNGVYFLATRAAQRLYKRNVAIYFDFLLGSTLGLQNFPTIGRNGQPLRRNYKPTKERPKNSGPYLYPTIKVVIGEGSK